LDRFGQKTGATRCNGAMFSLAAVVGSQGDDGNLMLNRSSNPRRDHLTM